MSKRNGVLAVVSASVLYGFLPVFVKAVLQEGMTNAALVFNQFLFTSIFAFFIIRRLKISLRVTRREMIELILAAFLGYGLTTSLLTASYSLIPVGLATMFLFTNPLFINLAMIVIFREKATPARGFAMITAVMGLVMMADFSRLNALGILLAVLSGIIYAAYVIANKKCSFARLDPFVLVFHVGTVNSFFFGITAAVKGELALPPTARAFILMVIVALFCTLAGVFLFSTGVRILGASTASVLNMLEPVVSLVAGTLIYHDPLGLKILAGCLLIVISGLAAVMDQPQEELSLQDAEIS
ncbi:MAG: DMT family transporter [Solobacterium sp.]|nr:DMT family transporter [Solobacterium sp.]